MYKKVLIAIVAIALLPVTGCEEFDLEDLDALTYEEVVEGLKQALEVGTDTSVAKLSIVDGYFKDELVKILLPPEAQVMYQRVSQIPLLSDLMDETILAINRSAEDAATAAKPIFVEAITNITIDDALNILHGDDTAATSYLKVNTYSGLYSAFEPKISTSLNKEIIPGLSAEASYSSLINTYNTASINGLLWDEVENNSLSEHTTRKALDGLFLKVAAEEKSIREDPVHRVTELLQKVFAEQD